MMGGPSICDLPFPRDRYRPDWAGPCERSGHSFETRIGAQLEDIERAGLIRHTSESEGDLPFDRQEASDLARRLEESGRGIAVHQTMASKVYMGMMRIRIGGALWELADTTNPNTFTILLPDGLMDVHQLLTLDPQAEMQRLRSRLNRLGADEADGYLFGAVHGEFNPLTELFDVHIHGLLTVVPLPEEAVRELDGISKGCWPTEGYVFPTKGKSYISSFSSVKRQLDMAMGNKLSKRESDLRISPWRFHDLRRTFATGMQRLGIRFEVTEALLNHVSGSRSGVVGVYQRHAWSDEKREAIREWASRICQSAQAVKAQLEL